jgi:hypothetical protein
MEQSLIMDSNKWKYPEKWYFSHKLFFGEKITIVHFYMNELVNYIHVINIEITMWYYMHKHILGAWSHGSQWALMNTKMPWLTIIYRCTRARLKHNKSFLNLNWTLHNIWPCARIWNMKEKYLNISLFK